MTILLGVIALFAILAFALAVMQAIAIVRLAPAGERLASYFALGWWKFGEIEARAGAGAAQHVAIYKRAAIAFIVFIIMGLILSGWAINADQPAASASVEPRLITDPRVIPAQYAFNIDLRRVATMPGAPILES